MQKLYLLIPIILMITITPITIYGDHTPLHKLREVILNIMNMLTNHEERIMELEETTSVTVSGSLGGQQSSVQSTCPILNVGFGDEPEMVQGWCPDGSHKLYMITDLRVTPLALISINVHDESAGIINGKCAVTKTGTIIIESGTFLNSFIIRCDETLPTMVMKYSVFV